MLSSLSLSLRPLFAPEQEQGEPSPLPLRAEQRALLAIINNFNSEALFAGDGVILFYRTGRMFKEGPALEPAEAIAAINNGHSIQVTLARLRPSKNAEGQFQVVPLEGFRCAIESEAALLSWWKSVGRNFCDGIF